MATATDGAMTIGRLAARSGFSAKTIRYYESIGLLPPPRRRPSRYRVYETGDLARLDFIAKAKQLGLALDEIRDVLTLRDAGTQPCGHVLALIDQHFDRVTRTIAELGEFRRHLARLRRDARRRAGPDGVVCRIIEHHVPPGLRLPPEGAAVLARRHVRGKRRARGV